MTHPETNEDPSFQVETLKNISKICEWVANKMLWATPFVLIAGFVLFSMAGLLVDFSFGFLFWLFVMGFLFLKAMWLKHAARLVAKMESFQNK